MAEMPEKPSNDFLMKEEETPTGDSNNDQNIQDSIDLRGLLLSCFAPRYEPPPEAIARGLFEILGNMRPESSNQPIDEPEESNEKSYAVLEAASFQPAECSQTFLQKNNQKSYDAIQPSMSFTVCSPFISEPINVVIGNSSQASHVDIVQSAESVDKVKESKDTVKKSADKAWKSKADRRPLPYLLFKPENSVSCPSCGVSVASKGHLQRHQSAHGADKHFKCVHCTCSFTRREKLSKHVGCAHPSSNS
nr:zinc finger and BTB domain-containing protein 14-like [Procambarus clarkii]